MAAPANRFTGWIDSLATQWSARLGNWFGAFIGKGIEGFMNILAKSFSPKLKPLIDLMESTGKVRPEVQVLLNELKTPTGEVGAALGNSLSGGLLGGAISSIIDQMLNPMAVAIRIGLRESLLSSGEMLQMYQRNEIDEGEISKGLASWGYKDYMIDSLKALTKTVFNTDKAVDLWKRGILDSTQFVNELRKLGWTPERIKAIIDGSYIIPGVQDLIRMAVKEAFTPEIAEKFGQYQDIPTAIYEWAEKIGLSKEWVDRYWAAHWDLPGANLGFEMLHRGIIDNDTLKLLLRALDVMPYWRDKLIQIAYSPYTRVDARRMWDLGVLNDTELKKAYTDIGYDNDHADTMVLWTKIYQTFPDLIARYKNGYINLDEVKYELLSYGLSEERANFLIETKVKIAQPERVAKERDLTKAEIIKGLKKGVIQRAEAAEFLYDMGYDEPEAKFILAINVPEEETTPALTLKELTKSDIISSLKKGLITSEDALARLIKLRYTSDDAQFIINLALATVAVITEPKGKELTKADITKGVKLGVITAEEGYLLLQDIGYEAWEAAYILTISVPVTTGSPDSYSEFKKLTQTWRASQGLISRDVPPELIEAERDLIAARQAYDFGKKRGLTIDQQAPLSKAVSDAQYRYRQLLAKYKLPT